MRALQRVQRKHGQLETPSEKDWKDSRSSYSRTSERNSRGVEAPFRDDGLLDERDDEQTNNVHGDGTILHGAGVNCWEIGLRHFRNLSHKKTFIP